MIKCEKCGLEFSDRVYEFHVERCNPKKNKNKNESKIDKEKENKSKLDKEKGKETKNNEDE